MPTFLNPNQAPKDDTEQRKAAAKGELLNILDKYRGSYEKALFELKACLITYGFTNELAAKEDVLKKVRELVRFEK